MSLYDYYREAEKVKNPDDENNDLSPYSFADVFKPDCWGPTVSNELVRAFIRSGRLPDNRVHGYEPEDIEPYVSRVRPPYQNQITAILNALNYKVSFVQGPPGTGKTDMILNLLSVLHGLRPGGAVPRVAVVSGNAEALKNIIDKIDADRSTDPICEGLFGVTAELGNSNARRSWEKRLRSGRMKQIAPQLTDDERNDLIDRMFTTAGRSNLICTAEHMRQFPFCLSTIHSVKRLYDKRQFDGSFDFVIVDECSQVNILLGLAALARGRQIVLIGDDEQLPPVIDADAFSDINDSYSTEQGFDIRKVDGRSFLETAQSVFADAPRVTLNEHFRCHPAIFGFCAEYVYKDVDMVIRSRGEGFPLRALWYEGDYFESAYMDGVTRQNIKQVRIFMDEEWPRLRARLIGSYTADGSMPSVGILCAFRAPLAALRAELTDAVSELEQQLGTLELELDDDDELSECRIFELSIHKAQGRGYDIVYLLNIEDQFSVNGRYPWGQRKCLVNVAVSRAKKELTVVTSATWLPDGFRKKKSIISAWLDDDIQRSSAENDLYVYRLLKYMYKNGGEGCFEKIAAASVFDDKVSCRILYRTGDSGRGSAPEMCVYDNLWKVIFNKDCYIARELPMTSIALPDGKESGLSKERRIDIAVCSGDRLLLAIEVDGSYHRFGGDLEETQRGDREKDRFFAEVLGDEKLMLRIPDNGSTANEMDTVAERLARNTDSGVHFDTSAVNMHSVLMSAYNRLLTCAWAELGAAKDTLRGSTINYTDPRSVDYSRSTDRMIYFCRYAPAYAFEYNIMYSIVLNDIAGSGLDGSGADILSFGCGSFIDGWGAGYAACSDAVGFGGRLRYTGIDRIEWERFIDSRTPFTDRLFEQLGFMKGDLCGSGTYAALADRVRGNDSAPLILMFPKLFNELDSRVFTALCQGLERLISESGRRRVYLCCSHNRSGVSDGQRRLNAMAEALKEAGGFTSVTKGYDALISDKLRTELVPCGRFVKAEDAEDCTRIMSNESSDEYVNIGSINSDFRHTASFRLIKELGEIEGWDLRSQIVLTSQLCFQIERLDK